MFELDYDLPLYDVASTYLEGQAEKNPQAQRGYSRDHRPDCRQVNIALVVSRCGMPLGYEIFAGNRNDATTLEEIVEHVEGLYGRASRICKESGCGGLSGTVSRVPFIFRPEDPRALDHGYNQRGATLAVCAKRCDGASWE